MWWNRDEQAQRISWGRTFMDAMRPWSVGTAPPNFLTEDEGAARLRLSYGEKKFARLVAVKNTYDPDNVFSLNHNIPPAATIGKQARTGEP